MHLTPAVEIEHQVSFTFAWYALQINPDYALEMKYPNALCVSFLG
jgi:hypothetical protein